MSTCRIEIHNTDGRIIFVDSKEEIQKVLVCLPKNINWKNSAPIKTLNRKYRLMIKELNSSINTGMNADDFHESIKVMVLPKLKDNEDYFIENTKDFSSTRNLTRSGWIAYIENFKTLANDIFNYRFIQ